MAGKPNYVLVLADKNNTKTGQEREPPGKAQRATSHSRRKLWKSTDAKQCARKPQTQHY